MPRDNYICHLNVIEYQVVLHDQVTITLFTTFHLPPLMKKLFYAAGSCALVLLGVACNNSKNFDYEYYSDAEFAAISSQLNLENAPTSYAVTLPDHLQRQGLGARPVSNEQALLGRVLFYDKKLSKDQSISCASCHDQAKGFGDDRPVSEGVYERAGSRNSIALSSVANFAAYYGTDLFGSAGVPFFWDNRAETAVAQNTASLTNPVEMDMHLGEVASAVQAQAYYAPLFRKAYGDATVTQDRVTSAIAAFINAMGSYQSPFDAGANNSISNWQADYNKPFTNLTTSQNRGKTLYMNNCASCHTESFGRPSKLMSNNGLEASTSDRGVGAITGIQSQDGMFKVPTLRNVALSAPYMHDGRFATLEQVIDHYSTNVQNHPNLGQELRGVAGQPRRFNFSSQDKSDLVAFLGSLTDEVFANDSRFSDPFRR
jgi:cytochrome c peroxidase